MGNLKTCFVVWRWWWETPASLVVPRLKSMDGYCFITSLMLSVGHVMLRSVFVVHVHTEVGNLGVILDSTRSHQPLVKSLNKSAFVHLKNTCGCGRHFVTSC